jgi:hypothetical protein
MLVEKEKMLLIEQHRKMDFKTKGIMIYSPDRGEMKKKVDGWAVLELVDDDLIDYYSYCFSKKFGIVLDKPSWKPHLSVIRGKYDETKEWGWNNGVKAELQYSHNMFWNHQHVWLSAESMLVNEIRQHYLIESYDRGHITIGRFKHNDIGRLPSFKNFNDLESWKNYANSPL